MKVDQQKSMITKDKKKWQSVGMIVYNFIFLIHLNAFDANTKIDIIIEYESDIDRY